MLSECVFEELSAKEDPFECVLAAGIAGNKKGTFEVEAQYLGKLLINLLRLRLKGTQNEAQVLNVTASYLPATPCMLEGGCEYECVTTRENRLI